MDTTTVPCYSSRSHAGQCSRHGTARTAPSSSRKRTRSEQAFCCYLDKLGVAYRQQQGFYTPMYRIADFYLPRPNSRQEERRTVPQRTLDTNAATLERTGVSGSHPASHLRSVLRTRHRWKVGRWRLDRTAHGRASEVPARSLARHALARVTRSHALTGRALVPVRRPHRAQ